MKEKKYTEIVIRIEKSEVDGIFVALVASIEDDTKTRNPVLFMTHGNRLSEALKNICDLLVDDFEEAERELFEEHIKCIFQMEDEVLKVVSINGT